MTIDPTLIIMLLTLAVVVLAGTLIDAQSALQTYKLAHAKLEESLKHEKEMVELYRDSYDAVAHELEQAYSHNIIPKHKES